MNTTNMLKSSRVRRGLTQENVADDLKVARITYISYENNPFNCPLDLLFKIIELLEGNIEEFLIALKQDYLSYKK